MPKRLVKKKIPYLPTEKAVDRWLQRADLTDYFTGEEFDKVRFAKLEQNLVENAYSRSLSSQPVTLRLPKNLIQKLKLVAMRRGTPYQTLVRMFLQEKVDRLLHHAA